MKSLNAFFLVLATVFAFSSLSHADAPLHKALGLNMDQARQVKQIEANYRKQMRPVRSDLKREERKLRRARSDFDSATVAQQEKIIARLAASFRQIRMNADDQIRRVLTPTQKQAFEGYIQQRQSMVGSSRDAKYFQ